MSINDAAIQAKRATTYAPNRVPTRRMIAIGATALVAATGMLVAFAQNSDREFVRSTQQPATQSRDEIVEDLVNRGLVPRQTLQPATQSRDEIVQDLVNRGLVPRQALLPAPQSRDEIVQDLVDRGLVPAATLED